MVDPMEVTSSKTVLANCWPEEVSETLRIWMDLAQVHNDCLASGLTKEKVKENFCRLVVSDRVRNEELWVARSPTQGDLETISDFIVTSSGYVDGLSFSDRYVTNQTFFIPKNGMMCLSHLETAPGDEVWVFDDGKMPFTIRHKGTGDADEYDFVGCCYAHGIMDGEIDDSERTPTAIRRRTISLY
jgi:hypothetical protein